MALAKPGEFSRTARYHLLQAANPHRTKAWCAREAGYSPNTTVAEIEATTASMLASRTPDQQRDDLAKVREFSMLFVASQALGIVTATEKVDTGTFTPGGRPRQRVQFKERAADRIRALRELKETLGYKAVERVAIQSRALILELTPYGREDLEAVNAFLASEGAH